MRKTKADADADWRETRRLQAWDLYQKGRTQQEIAQVLGVTQGAVSQWLRRARDGGGAEALRHQPNPGRRPALTPAQLDGLPTLLAQGPESFGFASEQWTTAWVAALLAQVFDVNYHPAHVSRLLRKHCPDWRDLPGSRLK